LHEILGSAEYFALESVKYRGRYLSCLPNGSIAVSRDKSQEISHFYVHVLFVYGMPQNIRPNPQQSQLNSINLPYDMEATTSSDSSRNTNSPSLSGTKVSFLSNQTLYQDDSSSSQSNNDFPPSYSSVVQDSITQSNESKTKQENSTPILPSRSMSTNFRSKETANNSILRTESYNIAPPPPPLPPFPSGLISSKKNQSSKAHSTVRYRPHASEKSPINSNDNNDDKEISIETNRPESIQLIKFE
jgi:hypothetical protein